MLAFDRSSVRNIDADGRMHVAVTNISKAAVNPYYGREIPGADELGLEPDRIYQVFRDPAELAKAAGTFNNIPLLSEHVPVSAADHRPDLVVGSTGTDGCYEAPYLKNSLVIWANQAIDAINSGRQKELSSAYRYRAVKESGSYEGAAYDLRMTDIVGNHVALVEAGRAGPDVVVSDQNPFTKEIPMTDKQRLIAAKDGARKALQDVLAQDADPKLLDAVLDKFAQDAAPESPDGGNKKPAQDDEDEEKKKAEKKAEDKDDEDEDEDDKKPAMDAAAVKSLVANAERNAIARMNAIREAEKAVAPHIGEIKTAMDSAESVYKLALDAAKVDVTGVSPSAYGAMVKMLPLPTVAKARVAMDASAQKAVAEQFPELGRFGR